MCNGPWISFKGPHICLAVLPDSSYIISTGQDPGSKGPSPSFSIFEVPPDPTLTVQSGAIKIAHWNSIFEPFSLEALFCELRTDQVLRKPRWQLQGSFQMHVACSAFHKCYGGKPLCTVTGSIIYGQAMANPCVGVVKSVVFITVRERMYIYIIYYSYVDLFIYVFLHYNYIILHQPPSNILHHHPISTFSTTASNS